MKYLDHLKDYRTPAACFRKVPVWHETHIERLHVRRGRRHEDDMIYRDHRPHTGSIKHYTQVTIPTRHALNKGA